MTQITASHIAWLQGIAAHLCDTTKVSQAFEHVPEQMEPALAAIQTTMRSNALPETPPDTPTVANRHFLSRFQLLLPLFPNPELWATAGLTRQQLHAIQEAFMNSFQLLEDRLAARQHKKDEAKLRSDMARKTDVHKVLKRVH